MMLRVLRPITRHLTTQPHLPSTSLILFKPTYQNPYNNSNDDNESSILQNKKANMGKMVDYLTEILPNALHTIPDSSYLSENIILRVSPTVSPNIPILKGRISNPQLNQGGDFVRNGDLSNYYGMFEKSDKIIIKWRTCLDDCNHLKLKKSGYALKGSHILEKFDIKKLWNHALGNDEKKLSEFNHGVSKVDDDSTGFERIIYGIFVFELDSNCEKIIVHNVENIEMYDKKDYIDDDLGKLARV
ncbi:unnamed protein product [Wickerhamomyces anomalus]